jgi:hypothetical protein
MPNEPEDGGSAPQSTGAESLRLNSRDLTDYVDLIFGPEKDLDKFEFISNFLETKSAVSDLLVKLKKGWNEELREFGANLKSRNEQEAFRGC